MKVLFTFYRYLLNKVEALAVEYGFSRVELRIAKLYKWRIPTVPYRCYISKYEMAKWIQLLESMLNDFGLMMEVFVKSKKVATEWKA